MTNVAALKEKSIQVKTGMPVIYPMCSREECLNISQLAPQYDGCYACNNSTICFVDGNDVFVTPCGRDTINELRSAGFVEKYFYVPFSNGDYPKQDQFRWAYLRDKARETFFC